MHMEKKKTPAKKEPVVKKEDKKKELSEKDLNKVSGGVNGQGRVKPRT